MAAGTWIYEKGTTSGGGTYIPPDAPPVVIGAVNVREVYNGRFEITVDWTPGVGAKTQGVAVFLEDPDISTLEEAPLDGSISLDGTSGVSGKWAPERESDSFESPAILSVDGQPKARDVRVYLQAYGTVKNATLVRANKNNPTPSVVAHIPAAAGEYVSGQEYAWLVTSANVITVPDFDNPAGPKYHLEFGYQKPDPALPLPPGLRPFAGVMTVYEYDDGTQKEALFLDKDKPQDWHSGDYDAGNGGHFKVWFCSRDVDGRRNSIVKGVTPMADVTIVYPPAGQPSAPYITDFTLTNPRHAAQPDGSILALATLTWKQPMLADGVTVNPRYAMVTFYRTGITPPRKFQSAGGRIVSLDLQVLDWPKVAEAWTIIAIGTDSNGRQSDDPANPGVNVPRVTWNIGPPGQGGTGSEFTNGQAGVGGATITTEQQLNSDGVVMMRHVIKGWTNPTDNSFGGMSIARVFGGDTVNASYWDAAKGATTLVTDWEPAPAARSWDFYFVSRDMQGHRNSILPGFTPKITHSFTPMAGDILASRMPSGWWDPSEFQWPSYPSGNFQALQFVAKKIYVGSILRVGGGPTSSDGLFKGMENGQIAVYNASNVLRAWAGQHDATATPDNPSPHSIYGGWFAELYVGGDGPPTAPLYAKQDGTVIVGGFDVTGGRYPYISIRNETNTEVGRIGARIGYAPTGNQPGPELTIQGAWFREFAYGGQSFTDWRMLAKMDPSAPLKATVQMRNIDLFTIDYMQNYPVPANPNAAMHLEFGYSAFVSDPNIAKYKFPGITLVRSGTIHGINIINRGIILSGPNVRMASLVTFNGASDGGDSPNRWWSELNLHSPVTGNVNVQLVSGSASNGSSALSMWDEIGIVNFSVSPVGDVYIRGILSMNSLTLSGNLTVNGSSTLKAVNASSVTINPGTLNCRDITTNGQAITCGAINAGTSRIDCGTIASSGTVTSTGFNTTASGGGTGQSFNFSFRDAAGNFLNLWVDGVNRGAVQVNVKGGVIVGFS